MIEYLRPRILKKVNAIKFISRYTELNPLSSGYYRGLCPFTEDPSHTFVVRPDGTWDCIDCGIGGNVIDFVAKYMGISESRAILYLDKIYQFEIEDMEAIQLERVLKKILSEIDLSKYLSSLSDKRLCQIYQAIRTIPSLDQLFVQELARQAEVSPRTIRTYMSSSQLPGTRVQTRISSFLNINKHTLFYRGPKTT